MSPTAGFKHSVVKALYAQLHLAYGVAVKNIAYFLGNIVRSCGHSDSADFSSVNIFLRNIQKPQHKRAVDPRKGAAEIGYLALSVTFCSKRGFNYTAHIFLAKRRGARDRVLVAEHALIGAAHVLYEYVGIENSVKYLLMLGIDPDHINGTGAGLSLGLSSPSMIELATAFSAIANSGTYQESYAFTQVLNPDGSVYIDVNEVQITREVFKPSTAWMLVDMLKGCVTPNLGTGSQANFGGLTVAGKTGTNTDNIGVTFAGMTGYYAGAVWIGSDNYKALTSDATGGSYAAPLWAAIMAQVHYLTGCTSDRAIIGGSASDYGLVTCEVCAVSGMLPTEACRHDANGHTTNTDWYLEGTQPTDYCNMHRAVTICSRSLKVATSSCSSTFVAGLIYIPEGHPLRYAEELSDVTEYFTGASIDENSTSLGYCTSCR